MTKKKAKNYIGELKMYAKSQGWDEEYQIACDIAMNDLEQEPTTKNNCAEQNGCATCSLDDGDDCCRKLYEESMQDRKRGINMNKRAVIETTLNMINMADIELVIKIPEIEYEHLTNQEKFDSLRKSKQEWLINKTISRITDAIPLPKGHGKLIDADLLKNQFPIWVDNFSSHVINNTISKAQTIIEADNEVKV